MNKFRVCHQFFYTVLAFLGFLIVSSATTLGAESVPSNFVIESSKFYTVSGSTETEIKDNQSITDGTNIAVKILWSVTDGSLVNANDKVTIKLPNKFFSFTNTIENNLIAEDTNGKKVTIGTFAVVNQNIEIIFNENIKQFTRLKNGFINIYGYIRKDTNTGEIVDSDISYPTINVIPSGPYPDFIELPTNDNLNKTSYHSNGSNEIFWFIESNYKDYQNVLKGTAPLTVKKNALLVDTLTAGQKVKTIDIYALFYLMGENNLVSSKVAANYYLNTPSIGMFVELSQKNNETWEEFLTRIKSKPGNYGIYTDQVTKTQSVAVYFGDLPGSIESPISLDTIKNDIKKNNTAASDLVLQNTFASLDRLAIATNNKLFMAPGVRLVTTVHKDTPDQTISNTANLYYNDTENPTQSESHFYYRSISGGVTGVLPNELKIIKKDDAGNLLPNIKFKLQKKRITIKLLLIIYLQMAVLNEAQIQMEKFFLNN